MKKIEVGTYLFASVKIYDDNRHYIGETQHEVVLTLCDEHLISEHLGIFTTVYDVRANHGFNNPGISFGDERW